jgi:hypothetical protein
MESEQLFPLTSEMISVSRLIGTPSFKKYQKKSNYIRGTWYDTEHQRTKVLSSHRKGRLVTLTTGINILSLHGNTAYCTVALAS